MISGERKKFQLAASRARKASNPLLGNLVLLREGDLAVTSTISFSEALVQFVGQKLPRGIADYDPAYLIVTKVAKGWLVEAGYVNDETVVPLWLAKERPNWLKSLNE